MSEWWTYSPRDFLMFSARAYYRLFELHNHRIWPLQPVMIAAGAAIIVLLLRPGARDQRIAVGLLLASWWTVAQSYFAKDYFQIHTYALWFLTAFAIQPTLFYAAVILRGAVERPRPPIDRWIGSMLMGFALVLQPLIGVALGRPWSQIETFGSTPDPTVAFTFGVLLLMRARAWWLWLIPLLWTAYTGMTLWLLHAPDALVLPLVALAALSNGVVARARRLPAT